MGHDLEMATRRSACDDNEKEGQAEGVRQEQGEGAACVMQDDGPSPCGDDGSSPSPSGANGAAEGSSPEAIDLINGIASQPLAQAAERPGESENGDEELDERGRSSPKGNSGSDSGPMLELSLKRPRSAVDNDGDVEERQPLRHSGGSAFSRCALDALGTENWVAVRICDVGVPLDSRKRAVEARSLYECCVGDGDVEL
jgi:pseudo-response regulator 7